MKDNLIEFYVNKFCFLNKTEDIDIGFISPILKRRTTLFDRAVLTVLNNVYSENVQNVVFSSRYGEIERLKKMIEQYNSNNEVSPNIFSGSVHNYPVAFFLQNIKKPVPYTALSASSESISAGLASSIASKYDNTVFCYCDIGNDIPCAMALNISHFSTADSVKYTIKTENRENISDKFDDYVKFFKNETKSLVSSLFYMERLCR